MRKRLLFVAGALGALAGGFVAFAEQVARLEASAARDADGVVVVTGGADRIAVGAQLIDRARTKRLLISGVNDKATREEMLISNPSLRPLESCCLDLGYRARNTIGNALEARDWAARLDFKSLILVTSASHMPRALAEFANAMPSTTILAHAAGGDKADTPPWWTDATVFRVLVNEYVKYLIALGRMKLEPEPGAWFPGSMRKTDDDAGAVSAPTKIFETPR